MVPHRGVSLTQVHPSPGADAETDIDIIAIHGLDTKSPDTWVWKSKSPDEDVNWLASPHMLPGRVGRARIFTCDWPADLFEQPDLIQKTAKVFARLLLAGIKRRPLPKTQHKKKKDRPIVFIASCLGGIILMKALLIADHPPSEYTAIRQLTCGVVFLATPFRGTSFQDVANWAEPGLRAWALIRGQKVSNLLDSVKGSTFHLEELVRSFTQLCQDEDYPCQVATFYETGMTSLHRKFPLSWLIPSSLVGLFCQPKPLVDSSSATLDIVRHPLPLDRSHVMVNKFKDPEDPDYKLVAGKIEEILQSIRTSSPLDDADAWLRNKHYTADRLKIERLSGDLLSMDQCYINLAVVEQRGQEVGSSKEDRMSSPLSLFRREKVETPDKTIQVELAAIFNQRKGHDGNPIRPRRILIRGRAGVGKTTLCKKIVHEFTQGTWREWNSLFDRVLWVPLRNLKRKERCEIAGYNFEQLFAHEYFSLSSDKSKLSRDLLLAYESELATNSSKTLFLLDGLDEVSQDLSESSMSDFLQELLKQPNIIVTSRPSGKMPLHLDLELETLGFYPDQVNIYVRKVFSNSGTDEIDIRKVNNIQSFLQNHPLLQGLVRIPIQLDALCYSWENIQSDMPETMTALYQAIELSLWKKDILRLRKTHGQNPVMLGHIQDADQQEVEELVGDEVFFLESLAFSGLCDDVIEFERKHLNCIRSKFIPGLLLNKTVPCLSFLRTSNPFSDNRSWSYHFIHLTFQEYFAARYFVRQWVAGAPLDCIELSNGRINKVEPVKFFQKHKYTARYDILWRFVAGLLDTKREETPKKLEEFFRKIEEEPRDLLGPGHQRLVMHCLSEISSKLPIRIDLEQQLSKWLLFECEFARRDYALLASEIEFPERVLDNAFREVGFINRNRILQSLKNRVTIPASLVEQITSWVEYNDSMYIRRSAIYALCRLSLPDKILNCIALQLEVKDESVQEAAVEALGHQADLPNDVLIYLTARLKDGNESVRAAAAGALRRQTLPNETLKDIAVGLNSRERNIRQTTISVLGQLNLPNEIIEDIAARLKDEDRLIRRETVIALRQQTALPNEILRAIAARLEDEDAHVRDLAVSALSRQVPRGGRTIYEGEAALPDEILRVIAAQLKNENPLVRREVIRALEQQTTLPNEIQEAIAEQLNEDNEYIRRTAVKTLCHQMTLPDEILEAIIARLNDDDYHTRLGAIEALGHQAALPNEIIETIAAQLNEDDVNIRRKAIEALGRQATLSNEILEAIAAQLKKYDYDQLGPIHVLGRQATLPNDILEAVAAQLNKNDSYTRRAAVEALGRQATLPDDILEAIVARLNDRYGHVRLAAVQTIAQQTALSTETLQAVAALLEDDNDWVRDTAERTIRSHKEFYCTLLKGTSVTSLYKVLLQRSFEEQLSWYIDDGHSCINMPEGIMKTPIDEHDDIVGIIKRARPEDFPTG